METIPKDGYAKLKEAVREMSKEDLAAFAVSVFISRYGSEDDGALTFNPEKEAIDLARDIADDLEDLGLRVE